MESAFKVMWIVVIFDLPVSTKRERRRATGFRNFLLDEGFMMKQFSVYLKVCANRAAADSLAERIGRHVPPEGDVSIMFFTDKQYGLTQNFVGKVGTETEEKPDQLNLF